MSRCPACNGVIGRDCYNPYDCMQISHNQSSQQDVQPYIDALKDARAAIEWYETNMPYVKELQNDRFHVYAHAMEVIDNLLPANTDVKNNDPDALPF